MKKHKTGIFSGSFNPIHIGHLALANYLCEYEGLDEIWFMVSPQNPLKTQSELWSDGLRLKLVELSINGYPHFQASDFEFHLPRPSYSVHTLEKLRAAYPERDFYFIIGSDNWARFDRWYQSERILKENNILIYPRPNYPVKEDELPETVRLVHSPVFWFMVSPQNPLKTQSELWSDGLRLKLVELSINGYPHFQASDFEFHLPRPSYSVHTLEKLRAAYPERDFYFIIGSDNWARFDRWYQSERILKENNILIYPRPNYPVKEDELPETVRLVHSPVFEISSTFIRKALDTGKDIRYFLHPAAWEYIKTNLQYYSANR